jgi:carbonic anhydrase/acetyltransferase-like protein (isoleucine patch superfamily)
MMEETIKQWHTEKTGEYRALGDDEIARLINQLNTAADWANVYVTEDFDVCRVHGCTFYGIVEIGAFTTDYTRYGNVTLRTGLYGSYFLNTSIGDNAAIHNLLYCCEQRIGDSVVISNVGEISSGTSALFGLGAVLDSDQNRKNYLNTIEPVNENGGRTILPCPAMTLSDAFIWTRYRGDRELMQKFDEITNRNNRALRPPKAVIGDSAVIINTKAVRRSLIGPAAVLDGSELVSNSTIMSDPDEMTVIGAAVQIRDSIVGYGNKIDSAAQLASVMTGPNVSIAKSARVTHAVIGDNAHIACCEIANCLVGPAHSQHHNNSFLIAAHTGGQSNVAAGATIGSNHTSRVNDGEIWAGRGFWPGLCVDLKHNSKFASFTMIAKGSYQKELDIKYPFCLVTPDDKSDATVIYPAFWFTRNMYAVMRCAQKFVNRDTRIHRQQFIEHDILAPDTVEEIFEAIALIEKGDTGGPGGQLRRADDATKAYRMMIRYYCAKNILPYMREKSLKTLDDLLRRVGPLSEDNEKWLNCGGMVISEPVLTEIISTIKKGWIVVPNTTVTTEPATKINSWTIVHSLFEPYLASYRETKVRHALKSLARLSRTSVKKFTDAGFAAFLQSVTGDCRMIMGLTRSSRFKDFTAPARAMVYESKEEMESVLGEAEDAVVTQTVKEMDDLTAMAEALFNAKG